MQAEFIQEERIDGTVVYYTRVDGYYVSDSLSFHKDRAEQYYARIAEEELIKKALYEDYLAQKSNTK
jgi:hypothetical protein